MVARDLINDSLIPLKTSDTGSLAVGMMEEYKVSHLPIVNNLELLGVISDADVYNLNSFDDPIGNHPLSLNGAYVKEDKPVFDVIQAFSDMKLTLLPVLDAKNHYLGVITMAGLVHNLSRITSIDAQGSILILEIAEKDYSLAQLCQIVEANDANVLSAYITSSPDSTRLEVTLKVNRMDISAILQSFNRYGFTVVSSYSDENAYSEILRERFDSLMNYLNI